jgi:hypothetical protein
MFQIPFFIGKPHHQHTQQPTTTKEHEKQQKNRKNQKMTGQFNTFSQASTAPLHSKPDPKLQTRQSVPATNPEGLDPIEASKQLAAYAAVDQHILPHHRVIGIGYTSSHSLSPPPISI